MYPAVHTPLHPCSAHTLSCSAHTLSCSVHTFAPLTPCSVSCSAHTLHPCRTHPQVLLYYPLYDALMAKAHKHQQALAAQSKTSDATSSGDASAVSSSTGFAVPMVCGAASRVVSVFAVAPLELARTLQQVSVLTSGRTALTHF